MTNFLKLNLQMFGANASKSTSLQPSGSGTKAYTLTASFTENSTNTENNTSNITVTATLKANGTYWSTSYNSTLEIYWHDNKTNTDTLKATTTFAGLSGYHDSKTATSTFNVTHKNDGTLSGYAKAVFTKGSTTSTSAPPSGNVQTNNTALTSIARVSTIACTSPYVGDTAIITITRNDNSYKDTLTYTIGSLTGTIATKTSNTTVSFDTSSLTNSIYQQMSSTSQSVQGTITVETFNANNTSLGTNSKTFNLYAKESDCKPIIDFNVVTTDQRSYDLTGNNTTLVGDLSSTSLTYTATPRNGATIVRKEMIGYTVLPPSPVTTWLITGDSLTMSATDSRGFQTTLTKAIDYVPYFMPSISLKANRTAPSSNEIKANFQGSFFNDSFGVVTNTLTLVCKYRIKGDNNWTTLRTLVENTDYTINGNNFYSGTSSSATDIVLDSNAFSYQNIYEIAIFYQETIVDTYTSVFVPKGVPVFNWEDKLFNVNGDLTVSDGDGENPVNILDKINNKGREKETFDKSTIWTSNSTTNVAIPSATKTLTTYGGDLLVFASMNVEVSSNVAFIDVFVDGTKKDEIMKLSSASGRQMIAGAIVIKNIASGSHTVALYVHVQNSSNTFSVYSYNNQQLTIVEL